MEIRINCKRWSKKESPKKILAIRLQALGDTIITLPYLLSLRNKFPTIELHFFTREEVASIPLHIKKLFDKIIILKGGRNAKLQFVLMLLKIPSLWLQRYDIVLDLQNNRISKVLRWALFPKAWSEFDKTSSLSAGHRTQKTIEAIGFPDIDLQTDFTLTENNALQILLNNRWNQTHDLIVLNPAGYSPSRNWPIENYIAFARLWIENVNPLTQFVLLLLPSLKNKADAIKQLLGDSCIDLTGKANQREAFSIIQKCKLVISEDSGLMHMAWVQRIHTIALFSSSRKDWSAPQGEWSICLDSSDMDCGPCGSAICHFGDNRCLVRYTPDRVVQLAKSLVYGA